MAKIVYSDGYQPDQAPSQDPNQSWGDYALSAMNAFGQGEGQGVQDYASTLQKGVTPFTAPVVRSLGVPEQYINTPEKAQQFYEQGLKDYNSNPDTNAHPLLAGLGRLNTNLLMTAPIGGAIGEAIPGIGMLSKIARGTAQGMLQGGLFNSPGQGTNVVNRGGAILGSIVGGLFAPLSQSDITAQAKSPVQMIDPNIQNLDAANAKATSLLVDNPTTHSLFQKIGAPGILGMLGGAVGGAYGFIHSGGDIGTTMRDVGIGAGIGSGAAYMTPKAVGAIKTAGRNLLDVIPDSAKSPEWGQYLVNRLGDMGVNVSQYNGGVALTHQDDTPLPRTIKTSSGKTLTLIYSK